MRGIWALAAALSVAATPALAQEAQGSPQPDPTSSQGFTPEEDLDCAIFVAALMAEDGAQNDGENMAALTSTMTYFLGRYEAQRGKRISIALAERYATYLERETSEIEQTCALRAQAFGLRLQDAGRAMSEVESEAAQRAQSAQPNQ